MSEYHYSACHTCRKVGILPTSYNPEVFHEEWVKRFKHEDHETEFASEHDDVFEARVSGEIITGRDSYSLEPITEKVADAYTDVWNETNPSVDTLKKWAEEEGEEK